MAKWHKSCGLCQSQKTLVDMEAEQVQLIIDSLEEDFLKKLHRIEQCASDLRKNCYPQEAVIADVLKLIEVTLQQKGILRVDPNSFNPLWFFVETERNIFLWRNRLSLAHKDKFEFWVDIDLLIEKRLRQLGDVDPENPFSPAALGSSPVDTLNLMSKEEEYLLKIQETFARINKHANALSIVGSLIKRDLGDSTRQMIVLPFLTPSLEKE